MKKMMIFFLFISFCLCLNGSSKLPWPHQRPDLTKEEIDALIKDLWIFDNFGSYHGTEDRRYLYFHDGLDVMLPNGTRLYAIQSGYVKAIPYYCIYIGDTSGNLPGYGWEYAHTGNFQVQVGDYVNQGDYIADVYELSHIHLSRVHLSSGSWAAKQDLEYSHPNQYFVYEDTIPPEIVTPFVYFRNNSDTAFETENPVIVKGDVDIVVPMRDLSECALSGPYHYSWCVSRVEYEITGKHIQPVHEKSFDFTKIIIADWPGSMYITTVHTVFKPHYIPAIKSRGMDYPNYLLYQYYIITNTDGTGEFGEVNESWKDFAWNTGALDESGNRLFPDGLYTITVTAYDFLGNHTTVSDTVEVRYKKKDVIRR